MIEAWEWWRDAATLALAFVAGVLSGAFSMGGQVLMKPGIRVLGASALDAVGTTVPMILPTVASATVRYAREGLVDWGSVRVAGPIGAVGSIAGSFAAPRIPGRGHLLQVATALLMLTTAVRMLTTAGPRTEPDPPAAASDAAQGRISRLAAVVVGALSGALSGVLGVGGGVLMVPGFHRAGMSLRRAIATALVCAGIFAVPATLTHAALGTIHWRFAVLLIVGAVPGARIGASLSLRASDRRLQLAVGTMLLIVATAYGVGEIAAWRTA
ncbi:MAG TPA: sulfite exporter TauE/SafE family protein [Actinomycetota bacterium]|nr:sulfite exporter TauE/SafE family protein [Actinomycetota bacterium]